MKVAKLEDFGMRSAMSPQERKAEYGRQCREKPVNQWGKFWMDVIDKDPEVGALVKFKKVKT